MYQGNHLKEKQELTNLLEYLQLKYGVGSAKELMELWRNYETEKAERERALC